MQEKTKFDPFNTFLHSYLPSPIIYTHDSFLLPRDCCLWVLTRNKFCSLFPRTWITFLTAW
jgi:hypothetical protein